MANSKPHCQLALESPRTITKRIEAYVARGAIDEDRRAQKALLLLKARDQQISLLERRVAQLENAAADMHAITLQVQIPTPETSYFSIPQSSLKSQGVEGENLGIDRNGVSNEMEKPERNDEEGQAVRVPELNFSPSHSSDSENDVFSTPVSPSPENDRVESYKTTSSSVISDESVYFLRNESLESTSSKQTSVDTLPRGISGEHVHQMNSTRVKEPDKELTKSCNVKIDKNILYKISEQIPDNNCSLTHLVQAAAALLQSKEITAIKQREDEPRFDNAAHQRSGRGFNGSNVSFGKLESSRFVKLSPSVPWVRAKRRLRRKSRGHELGIGAKAKDIRRERLGFEFTSKSLPAVNPIFLNSTNDQTGRQRGDVVPRTFNSQEEAVLADPTPRPDHDTAPSNKHVIIQTTSVRINEPSGFKLHVQRENGELLTKSEIISRTNLLGDRKSSKYLSAEDEPAPQWLIEEALSRGRELSVINRYEKTERCFTEVTEDIFLLKTKYEGIISDLEEKLNDVRAELENTNKKKNSLRDKFKRALRNIKMESMRENEILQEKIVKICGSVLEKFGPYAFDGRKVNSRGRKGRKPRNRRGNLSKKLNRKLRSSLVMSNKLRDELSKAKEVVEEKTRQHESLDKRFTRLKQELETTELNLNDLINENSSLRKKFEDTREWMELKIGKDRHERNNFIQLKDMQKSRDILNLKKKVDEDSATITQLKNKLLRLESANANKGFLLNSYKGQLSDLAKEKEQLISRSKELENDLAQSRNTNAQLKAKISLLLNEKEKLLSENGKSELDLKGKMESKLTFKYEQSMLQEIESMKSKCDERLEVMRGRMNAAENCSLEYSAAISEFLRQLNSHVGDSEMDSSFDDGEASHREAHQTACTILNMTPKELSGFMKGRPANKINTWLADVRKITSRNNFSDALANFLFKKASSSV